MVTMHITDNTVTLLQAKMMSQDELKTALANTEKAFKRPNLTALDIENITQRRSEILTEIKNRI